MSFAASFFYDLWGIGKYIENYSLDMLHANKK